MTGSTQNASVTTDAWTFALDLSRPYFGAPPARELPIEFAAEAKQLGRVVRALHEQIAGDDSDHSREEPALPDDLDAWIDSARRSIESGLTLLERQLSTPSFAKTRVAEAQALVKRKSAYLSRVDELADTLGDDLGMRIRVLGNLSLYTVTRTANGNFSIDNGTNASSDVADDVDRRASPLRDVASMLRSFSYASATLVAGVEKTSDLATRELRAGRWERDVRSAFLEAYIAEVDDDAPGILPEDPANVSAMIALFETDKAFDDLAHELNDRPASVWIPMRGIAKLLAR